MSTPPKRQLAMIDGFLIDCLLSADHTFESDITDYPIEGGSTRSDSIKNKPHTVVMECIVSSTPIGDAALVDRGDDPAVSAYVHLKKVHAAEEPVTIRTSLETFESMGLKNLSVPQRNALGEIHFTATFRHIEIVDNTRTKRVAVPMAQPATKENKPAKQSTHVTRRVDKHDGTWYDPDILDWREGASFNSKTGLWEFFKGRPIFVSREDWQLKPHLTDAEYRQEHQRNTFGVPIKTLPNGKIAPATGKDFTISNGLGERFEIIKLPGE